MEVTIRQAKKGDAASIVEMVTALAAHEGEPQPSLTRDAVMRMMQAGVWFFVAEDETQLQGFMMGYLGYDLATGTTGVHMGDLFVYAEKRNGGVGTALLRAMAQIGLEKGAAWMQWTMLSSNREAKGFYDRLVPFIREDILHMGISKEQMQALCN